MKTSLLLFIFIIVPFCLFSQQIVKDGKYSMGKIFLQKSDTVNVYVKVESIYNMQDGIQYLDSAGNEHSLLPSKALGFCLLYKNDTMYFESRKDLNMVLFVSRKTKNNFVYRISGGSLPLYYFIEKQLVMDGIDQVQADRPRYLVLFDQDWYPISSKYFIGEFQKLFSNLKDVYNAKEMKVLLNEIIDGKYSFEETPAVIDRLSKLTKAQN